MTTVMTALAASTCDASCGSGTNPSSWPSPKARQPTAAARIRRAAKRKGPALRGPLLDERVAALQAAVLRRRTKPSPSMPNPRPTSEADAGSGRLPELEELEANVNEP